ncbi:MAG: OmpA family protein [Bacteroidales bacterium]|nr:OmpA family protein [Bacteroidales bacterium]
MKRIALTLIALTLACASAHAQQDFLNRLKNKTKDNIEKKIENRVEQKVDSTVNSKVDNALDRLFNPNKSKTENKANETKPQENNNAVWTCAKCGTKGNTGKFCSECGNPKEAPAAQPAATPKASESKNPGVAATVKAAKAKYAKCDFVPGDDLFFEDDFQQERLGEFPLRWDLFDGYVEIASLEGRKVMAFTDNGLGQVTPNMKDKWAWLPDSFTLEFDLYLAPVNSTDDPTSLDIQVLFGSKGQSDYYNAGSDVHFFYREDGSSSMLWSLNKPDSDMRSTGDKSLGLNPGTTDYASDSPIKAGEWNHFAFSFNKRAFKGYVNGFRVINVPSMEAPGYFYFNSNGYYRYSGISNVRICDGAVPLYDRLISNGKIVTYNITFETGKADLKEESIIELQRIATLMAQYSDLELVVEGHTDNTGSASTNNEISMKRAENVVAALVELGVEKSRLTPVGKGSSEPIGSNNTAEGRSKNRRVEFIKK